LGQIREDCSQAEKFDAQFNGATVQFKGLIEIGDFAPRLATQPCSLDFVSIRFKSLLTAMIEVYGALQLFRGKCGGDSCGDGSDFHDSP
jgi:hypothetical protein